MFCGLRRHQFVTAARPAPAQPCRPQPQAVHDETPEVLITVSVRVGPHHIQRDIGAGRFGDPSKSLARLLAALAACSLLLEVFPPLPLPLLRLLWLLPELLPPRLEAPGEFEIAAARDLLISFLRSPSYCLSFFTLGP